MDTFLFKDIGLKPSVVKAAARQADREGLTPAEYLRNLVERDVVAAKTFEEAAKPIREAFERGGRTEADLDDAVRAARRAIAGGKRAKARR